MRFACHSLEGTSLSWWARLQDEGHEVLVYIEPEKGPKDVGLGIVPKTQNYADWVKWGRGGVYFFDCSGSGKKAELLRMAGERVIGGGVFCDKLESDREYANQLVKKIGAKTPEYKSFSSISETQAYVKKSDKVGVFKSNRYLTASATYVANDSKDMYAYLEWLKGQYGDNVSNILQEKLDGFALSTARWWNGHVWSGPYEGTIEHKKFMDGDKGGSTGCSFNMVWFYKEEPELAHQLKFKELGEAFKSEKAPPGLYDINALLSEEDGEPYFLEFTPRLGFDSEPTSQLGISNLGKLLSTLASGGEVDDLFDDSQVYCSVRLSISPYPWEDVTKFDMRTCLGTPVHGVQTLSGSRSGGFVAYGLQRNKLGDYTVSDPHGLVGLIASAGTNAKEAYRRIYAFLDDKKSDFHVPNLQYRTDALKYVEEDIKTILDLGYEVR